MIMKKQSIVNDACKDTEVIDGEFCTQEAKRFWSRPILSLPRKGPANAVIMWTKMVLVLGDTDNVCMTNVEKNGCFNSLNKNYVIKLKQ